MALAVFAGAMRWFVWGIRGAPELPEPGRTENFLLRNEKAFFPFSGVEGFLFSGDDLGGGYLSIG